MASKDLEDRRFEYVLVTFQTTYQTYDSGVYLAVIGSIPCLGSWCVDDCLLLTNNGSGKWEASISMFANTSFFWKLVVVSRDKKRIWRWEDIQNRDTNIGDSCEFVLIEAPWEAPETILLQYIQYEGHPLHDFAYFKKKFGKAYSTDPQHLPVYIPPVGGVEKRVRGPAATRSSEAFGWSLERNQLKTLAAGKTVEGTDEETVRRKIFDENVRFVVLHNREYKEGRKSFHVGVNCMSDLNDEEIKAIRGGPFCKCRPEGVRDFQLKLPATPSQIDWGRRGYVTPVKNQGQYDTSWTFSATGALEGQHAKATGELVSLSEQQLVDCCHHAPDGGKNMNVAFEYISKNGGIETEEQYPYEGEQGPCRFDKNKVVVKVKAFYQIRSGDESQLQEAVGTIGPISVAIDCSPRAFNSYAGGIYDEESANSKDLNHAVLVVGYGEENGKEYWIVKNSRGDEWGEAGYIRMARNKRNQSGIATMASYPEVE